MSFQQIIYEKHERIKMAMFVNNFRKLFIFISIRGEKQCLSDGQMNGEKKNLFVTIFLYYFLRVSFCYTITENRKGREETNHPHCNSKQNYWKQMFLLLRNVARKSRNSYLDIYFFSARLILVHVRSNNSSL